MQNIIFILLLSTVLSSDTVGLDERTWVSIPAPATQVESLDIAEEIVIPAHKKTLAPIAKTIPINLNAPRHDAIPMAQRGSDAVVWKNYQQVVIDFVNPLWEFMQKYTAQFVSLLTLLAGLFYLLLYRPLSRRRAMHHEVEMDLPQAINAKDAVKTSLTSQKSILSQAQYATLYGLINESFIYEKEHVILDKTMTQEKQNREVISLEWKFNQILHFSLPKLSSDNEKRFQEGVKELLDEEISRDIIMIALKDIVLEEGLDNGDKLWISHEIKKYETPERRSQDKKGLNPEVVSYSSYLAK